MLVSGVQLSDIHVSILFQILFLFRLLHNIEQSSLFLLFKANFNTIPIVVLRLSSEASLSPGTVGFPGIIAWLEFGGHDRKPPFYSSYQ